MVIGKKPNLYIDLGKPLNSLFFPTCFETIYSCEKKVEINKKEKIHEKKMTPAFFFDFTRQFLLLWMVTTGRDLCLLVYQLHTVITYAIDSHP